MIKLEEKVVDFLMLQPYTIISSVEAKGLPHNSCKGIVQIDPKGLVYLLDLYHGSTSKNLKENASCAITAVNEHKFRGYCLKGKARLADDKDLTEELKEAWEKRVAKRITQRLLKNISGQKGHPEHPEALLPQPKYLIVMEVEEVVDLTPQHIKQKQ